MADEEALCVLMKLDQSRYGDMINKLTNDAMRGTPWPATLDEAYLQASIWCVQAPRKDSESSESATYVIADTIRKKEIRAVREENIECRGDSEVFCLPEDRASGKGLSRY